MRIAWFMAALAFGAPSFARAADLQAPSRIDAVTVYPDAAVVTRVIDVDLPAGATTIVIKGLPFALDPDSLRVSGAAEGELAIGAVEARLTPAEKSIEPEAELRLKALVAERDGLQAEIDALAAKQAMITLYSQTPPQNPGEKIDVKDWGLAFATVGGALAQTSHELYVGRAHIRDLQEAIEALQAGRMQKPNKAPQRDIAISLEATSETKARLELSYRVAGPSWRPAYDARLDAGGAQRKPALELARRAIVSQQTGEDWSEVALSVSTMRVKRGAAPPDLIPQRLEVSDPKIHMSAGYSPSPGQDAHIAAKRPAREMQGFKPGSAPEALQAADQRQATLEVASAYQAVFVAPGRVSVPTDGATKNIALTTRRFEPQLTIASAPELDPTAYLQAHLRNDEDAALLAGAVSIQRDGVYVGQARLPLVAPGDEFDLGFGADDRVKITRLPIQAKEKQSGWIDKTKIDQREFKTIVKNLHDFPIHVTIAERIPFTENDRIKIELLPQTTAPTHKQVGDKRGVMDWVFDLAPQEAKEIRLAYETRWPADLQLFLRPAPMPD